MISAYIGVGSNLGNRRLYIRKAVDLLKRSGDIVVEKTSSIYETDPVGGPARQSKFLNGVVKIKTSLKPDVLLKRLQGIEQSLKRKRTIKNGPRTIDLDILAYGSKKVKTADLFIPHPRFTERDFVLKGFCEVAPCFIHPMLGESVRSIYKKVKKENKVCRS